MIAHQKLKPKIYHRQRSANIGDDHVRTVHHHEGKDVEQHGRLDGRQPGLRPHQGRVPLPFSKARIFE